MALIAGRAGGARIDVVGVHGRPRASTIGHWLHKNSTRAVDGHLLYIYIYVYIHLFSATRSRTKGKRKKEKKKEPKRKTVMSDEGRKNSSQRVAKQRVDTKLLKKEKKPTVSLQRKSVELSKLHARINTIAYT